MVQMPNNQAREGAHMRLIGDVAIITGASRSIGAAIPFKANSCISIYL